MRARRVGVVSLELIQRAGDISRPSFQRRVEHGHGILVAGNQVEIQFVGDLAEPNPPFPCSVLEGLDQLQTDPPSHDAEIRFMFTLVTGENLSLNMKALPEGDAYYFRFPRAEDFGYLWPLEMVLAMPSDTDTSTAHLPH